MVINEYYKNSNTGDIIQKMYAEEIKNSESYFKNGLKCGKEELSGCVPISEKKAKKILKKLKEK